MDLWVTLLLYALRRYQKPRTSSRPSSLVPSSADESSWQGVSSLPDFKETFPKWRPRSIAATLDSAGVDLLSKMLVYTPQHRITAKAAMQVGVCGIGGRGRQPLHQGPRMLGRSGIRPPAVLHHW